MGACRRCAAAVPDNARFCPSCGNPISTSCPRCDEPVAPGARFCLSCGSPIGAPADVAEERKLVTILFADITGSTSLGERLDPERMRSLLRRYFDAMSEVITSWGGRLEKFIGDAIMATFGVPTAREDDAERALRAALEMLERLESLNVDFRERHGVAMQIRIGVNTGEVIAPLDPGEQMIVAGDAVNVAARLEQAADPGTILVGDRTHLATRGSFEFGEPRELDLKGKAQGVSARQLFALSREPAVRGVPGLRAPLVGRDRELRTLLDLLDEAVESSRPRLVLLNGPAGIGKSRLMQEFVREAAEGHGDVRILRGRCVPMGHGITYWALAEILRSFAGISLDETAEEAQDKLRVELVDLAARTDLGDDDRMRLLYALAMTAGLTVAGNPLENLEPDAVAAELGRAWPAFLSAIAKLSPVVVVIEDVHWAGDQLVEMVERLLGRSTGPILILVTARPEFAEGRPGFAARSEDAVVVPLRPLSEQQSSNLIAGLLASAELPEALRAEILTKAEGNPFFVEEMVRRLIDENALVYEDGAWRTTAAVRSVTLPDSVLALLAARIDALPLHEKRVLQEASVIGRIFWEAPVERSAGNGKVGPALLSLEQKGLILARPTSTIAGQPEYIFKHALVRDVAYASLPKARRARAHAEVAGWVEELAGERVEEFGELLAHHYRRAIAAEDSDLAWEHDATERQRVRARAFEACLLAGASARRRYAVARAIELHEAALSLAANDEERARALEELGDDHFSLYHCDEALASYQEALALAEGPGRDRRRVALVEKIGFTCLRWGAFRQKPDPAEMEAILERGLAEAYDDESRANLLLQRANAFVFYASLRVPDPVPMDQRLAWARAGFETAEQIGEPRLLSRAINALATLLVETGQFREALEVSLRSLNIVDAHPTRDAQAEIFAALCDDVLRTAGDPARAVELGRRSFELARGTSDHELMHTTGPLLRALYHVGAWSEIPEVLDAHLEAYPNEAGMSCPEVQSGPPFGARFSVQRGDPVAGALAVRLTDALLAASPEPGGPRSSVLSRAMLAEYLLAVGRPDAALDVLNDRAEPSPSPAGLRDVAAARIEALAALERWDELRAYLDTVRPLVDGTPLLRPIIARAEAAAAAADGRRDEALGLLRAALNGFERLRHPFETARTQELLAGLLDGPEHDELLEAAASTYERLGATPHVERVRGETLSSP